MKNANIYVIAIALLGLFACSEDNTNSVQGPQTETTYSSEQENQSSSVTISSSSTTNIASSSSVASSSSLSELPGCKTETEDNCEYGTLIDSRTSQTYKTVKIGTQEWMTEDLIYNGRTFTWAEAVGIDKDSCNTHKCKQPSENVQGICPDGSHLPSAKEYSTLLTAIGGRKVTLRVLANNNYEYADYYENTSYKLKSSSGWPDGHASGDDRYGFSATPNSENQYYANYWASTENDSLYAYNISIFSGQISNKSYSDDNIGLFKIYKKRTKFAIRCIKD